MIGGHARTELFIRALARHLVLGHWPFISVGKHPCNTPMIISFQKYLFNIKHRELPKHYRPCDNVSAYSEFCSGKHITKFHTLNIINKKST